jgi:hypothetical protein
MRAERREVEEWERQGRPSPPPHLVKQRIVMQYGREHRVDILIETGTLCGDMVHGCRKRFKRIVSVELDYQLYRDACKRFAASRQIEIHQGDSAKLLPKVIEGISEPCLFWLDGHYSAGITARGELNTPIMDELLAICEHPIDDHVILIDDARCFTGEEDYPTVDEVREFVMQRKPHYEFELDSDIMRFTPKRVPGLRSGVSAKR